MQSSCVRTLSSLLDCELLDDKGGLLYLLLLPTKCPLQGWTHNSRCALHTCEMERRLDSLVVQGQGGWKGSQASVPPGLGGERGQVHWSREVMRSRVR